MDTRIFSLAPQQVNEEIGARRHRQHSIGAKSLISARFVVNKDFEKFGLPRLELIHK